MQRLLVATDLSARSDRAVERAVLLCGRSGASLSVLHVLDEELPPESSRGAEAQSSVRMPMALGREASIDVVSGSPALEIVSRDADLIVLGKHHEHPVFRGTTAERTIRYGSRPVLVVKNRAHPASVTCFRHKEHSRTERGLDNAPTTWRPPSARPWSSPGGTRLAPPAPPLSSGSAR